MPSEAPSTSFWYFRVLPSSRQGTDGDPSIPPSEGNQSNILGFKIRQDGVWNISNI